MSRIWIDVEDFFSYATCASRPSGIQRLAFEVEQAMVAAGNGGDSVRFVRHDPRKGSLVEIPWSDMAGLYASLTVPPLARRPARIPPPQPDAAPAGRLRAALRPVIRHLPPWLREPMAKSFRAHIKALGLLGAALRTEIGAWQALKPALLAAAGRPDRGYRPLPRDGERRFATTARPGDMLLVLGAPWWEGYPETVREVRRIHGLRLGVLIYDLIPALHPEWCDRRLIAQFLRWHDAILPQTDLVMAISRSTAQDVETYAARHAIALPGPVRVIPVGTGFSPPPGGPAPAAPSPDLAQPGSYVLIVSTIEARKNHLLLFRVWQRLLADMPAESVPKLVFAGRVGWMVDDLMVQLANTDWLDGRIVLIESPSDADLAALYRGCLFTLFPSFYEGWGLPITESLAFGKPCLTADNSSLPEAGVGLTRTFDADNLHSATQAIREVLEDHAGLAAWEARIRAEFHPVPWSAAAGAVLAACEESDAGSR